MHIVLVHCGDVVEAVLPLFEHTPHAVLNNDRQLIGISRVVAQAIGNSCRDQVAVTILMLESFAVQSRAASSRPNQKTSRLTVTRRPGQITNALETEHGVEDIKRHHREIRDAVGSGRCEPGGKRAGLVDALLKNLTRLSLLVIQNPA